jgi:hypothetical protein
MAVRPITWQRRCEYLASVLGMTPQNLAFGIDQMIRGPASAEKRTPVVRTRTHSVRRKTELAT